MNFALTLDFSKAAIGALALASALPYTVAPRPAFAQISTQGVQVDRTSSDSIEDALNIWEKRLSQEGLILLGYHTGFADGNFGQCSRIGIASYQRDYNRASTGMLLPQDALELSKAALDVRNQLQWHNLDSSKSRLTMPQHLPTKDT